MSERLRTGTLRYDMAVLGLTVLAWTSLLVLFNLTHDHTVLRAALGVPMYVFLRRSIDAMWRLRRMRAAVENIDAALLTAASTEAEQ